MGTEYPKDLHWPSTLLDAYIDAEVCTRNLCMSYLLSGLTERSEASAPLSNLPRIQEETSFEEVAANLRWKIKRTFMEKLAALGLFVNVKVLGDSRPLVKTTTLTNYIALIDQAGYENKKVKFYPPQFVSEVEFGDFCADALKAKGVETENLIAA